MKRILTFAAAVLYILSLSLKAEASSLCQQSTDSVGSVQRNISDKAKESIIDLMADQYTPWERLETTGKLKMSKLPLSPTVKIWMKRGESVKISIRVPFAGEVGRVELSNDSVLMVNKMKKCYCKESASNLSEISPTAITEIQNFLLGRMILFGAGEFTKEIADRFDIYQRNGDWMVVPSETMTPDHFVYGYIVGDDGLPKAMMLESEPAKGGLTLIYTRDSDLQIDFEMNLKEKNVAGSLELDKYKSTTEDFQSLRINNKYKRVSIKEFFRSF